MIRQLNIHDILNITNELKLLQNSKVQNISTTDDSIGIELYNKSTQYLWFYLHSKAPQILLFDQIPKVFKLKKTSPVMLFLKAHLVGKRLTDVHHDVKKGRVVNFVFGYDEPVDIEVRLFPHGANLIVTSQNKSISFYKPKDLKTSSPMQDYSDDSATPRRLAQISKDFLDQKQNANNKPKKDPEAIRQTLILKKQKALDKMKELSVTQADDKWKTLGLWLTENQTLSVPSEFSGMLPRGISFSEALQYSFDKAKKNAAKIDGTNARIEALKSEIEKLKHAKESQFLSETTKTQKTKTDTWTGYRLNLGDKLEVFVGKNAKENLTILRHAQSWDYWLHIKDYPGAHGILRRPRNHEVESIHLIKAAQFVAARSKKSAHFLSAGDTVEVLVVERRYIRPIKGDKLGRVTFTNEKPIQVTIPDRI